MADKPEFSSKRMSMLQITGRDFARFLQSKLGEDDRCPLCTSDTWTIFCPGPDDIYRLGLAVRNQERSFYVSTFGYHCDNCGYVRCHHAATVHKWVMENPEAHVDDESAVGDTSDQSETHDE